MKSSHDASERIIRGASIDGVVFCTPSGEIETEQSRVDAEKQQLKTLETFWRSKGFEEGRSKGFDEGFAEGESKGHRRGEQEGKAAGLDEGRAEGLEEGLAKGRAEAEEELSEALEQAGNIVAKLHAELEGAMEKARAELIAFTLAVAEQILLKELSDPARYKSLVERLLQKATRILEGETVRVMVHPDACSMLERQLDQLKVSESVRANLRIMPEERVNRGDCRIETEMGLLNFDIKRQLEQLEKSLLEIQREVIDDAAVSE